MALGGRWHRAAAPHSAEVGVASYLYAHLRRYRWRACLGLTALVVAASGSAAGPLLIKVVFDKGLFGPAGPDRQVLIVTAAAIVLVAILSSLAGIVSTYFSEGVIHALLRDLRIELFRSVVSAPLARIDSRQMGEVNARFTSDLGLVESVLESSGIGLLSNGLFLVVAIAAMAYLSIPLCLGSLALTPLFIWITRQIAARQRDLTARVQADLGRLGVVVDENLSTIGAMHARLFDRVGLSVRQYGDIAEQLYRLQLKRAMLLGRLDAVISIFFATVPALLYVGAGYAIIAGHRIDAGTLVAFVAVQFRFFGPAGQVMQLYTGLVALQPAVTRIAEYLDADEPSLAQPGSAPRPLPGTPPAIVLRQLSYRYPGPAGAADESSPHPRNQPFMLRDIDLELAPCESVGLVGASGSGKSTLVLVLAGLLAPHTGLAIVGDRRAIGSEIPTLLAGVVGLVTQVPLIANASFEENIAYGCPQASREQIIAAAEAANLHTFVRSLPDGYRTQLGQAGAKLSGGQRQRLAVARVALMRPSVIIFDETSAALDRETEESMWAAVQATLPPHSQIVISHRRETIERCERVYFLDRGRIIESGTHPELLDSSPPYRSFWLGSSSTDTGYPSGS